MQGDIKMSKLASCGGCGAKVGAGMLSQILQGIPTVKDENLLVGYDTSDDAAVYKVSDDLAIVQTLDFFPPIVDVPYMFGQVAAAHPKDRAQYHDRDPADVQGDDPRGAARRLRESL